LILFGLILINFKDVPMIELKGVTEEQMQIIKKQVKNLKAIDLAHSKVLRGGIVAKIAAAREAE
jgi:hypothetical protein